MSAFDRLREAMAVTLNVAPDAIRVTTTQQEVAGWDSLAHINLMIALENTFDVMLEPEDFARLTSVPLILAYLNGQGGS